MFLKMKTGNSMKDFYHKMPNGYMESIQKGMNFVRTYNGELSHGTGTIEEQLLRLKKEIIESDAIVIGAGAGLSTSAGLTYSGDRFEKYFFDFIEKYGIGDMYSGGFYTFPDDETRWAWWARHIYFNRYVDPKKPVYFNLLKLIKDKNYFVITTNVDHQFQRAGFDKKRLFYTQGDYGLFQSVNPDIYGTFDNKDWVMEAMKAQGFIKNKDDEFDVPDNKGIYMSIPTDLIPKSLKDGSNMTMNLRSDDSFVEDDGWHIASAAYSDFLKKYMNKHILFLEIGVGYNTPVIIKYPFWGMVESNSNAVYACLNYGEAFFPKKIEKQSICINSDIGDAIDKLLKI